MIKHVVIKVDKLIHIVIGKTYIFREYLHGLEVWVLSPSPF